MKVQSKIIKGACHCKSISYEFESSVDISVLQARTCECSFCDKNQASHISDPKGKLSLFIREGLEVNKYFFGLKTAKFYSCPICGSYICSVLDDDGKLFAALNINSLDKEFKDLITKPSLQDFGHETRKERKERRRKNWTPLTIKTKSLQEQMGVHTKEGFDDFVQEFKDHSLSKNKWTHEAHFVIALWFVLEYGYDEAVLHVREGIKNYNEATGVVNTELDGYHETITLLYLKLVKKFIDSEDDNDPITLLAKLLKSEIIHPSYPFKFYSQEKLFLKDARFNWLEPDLISL